MLKKLFGVAVLSILCIATIAYAWDGEDCGAVQEELQDFRESALDPIIDESNDLWQEAFDSKSDAHTNKGSCTTCNAIYDNDVQSEFSIGTTEAALGNGLDIASTGKTLEYIAIVLDPPVNWNTAYIAILAALGMAETSYDHYQEACCAYDICIEYCEDIATHSQTH